MLSEQDTIKLGVNKSKQNLEIKKEKILLTYESNKKSKQKQKYLIMNKKHYISKLRGYSRSGTQRKIYTQNIDVRKEQNMT